MTLQLTDSRRQVCIGMARNDREVSLVTQGATSILHRPDGSFAGVYIDNETGTAPVGSAIQLAQRDAVARSMLTLAGEQRVVVGLFPSEPTHRIPGCICAYEWYPFHKAWGMPTRDNLGLDSGEPGPQAWILQWNFAWPQDAPPTWYQKSRLLGWVKLHHPRAELVWLY